MKRLACLLAMVAALLTFTRPAGAVSGLSSGLAGGPVGAPVISTVDYTNRSDVLVLGDSITVRSYKALAAALPGKRLAVNAQSGSNTSQSIGRLIAQLDAGAKLPPILVMATGANDIFAPAAMRTQVPRLLALVQERSPATRVYWVNVSVLRPAYAMADRVNSAKVDELIRLGCVGSCRVVSWSALLAAGPRSRFLDAGGVHPGPAGQVAWGEMIARALG